MAALFNDPTGLGYNAGNLDLASQMQDLQRKRQIYAAMLAKQFADQPTQMAGNIAIRNSPLAPFASALVSNRMQSRMQDLSDQERQMVLAQQQKAADAVNELMGASQPTPGTPTTVTEVQGPTPEGTPIPPYVQPGTAPAFDPAKFSAAYTKAQYAGADPALLGSLLQQFNRGRMLTQMGFGSMVPGWNQGAASARQLPTGEWQAQIPVGAAGGGTGGSAPGNFGGVPAQAVAMMLTGDPALEKIGAAISEYGKPVNVRPEGGIAQPDASGQYKQVYYQPKVGEGLNLAPGGQASPVPGYREGIAGNIQAKGQAEAPYQRPVEMPVPSGGTMPVPFNQFIGGQVQRLPQPLGQAPQVQQIPVRPGDVASPQTLAGPADGPYPSAEAALAARQQPGYQFGPQSTGAKAEATTRGEGLAKQGDAIDQLAQSATVGRATVAQMKDALAAFDPNALAPARQKAAELVQAIGGGKDLVAKVAGGDLAAMQEFGKLAYGNAAQQLRAMLPGQRLTQMEILQNYLNSPNPTLQKSAISTMLEMQDGLYRWQQEKQQAKEQWIAPPAEGGKGTMAGFEGWWNRNHPLTGTDANGQSYIPTLDQVRAIGTVKPSQQFPAMRGEIPGQTMAAPPANELTMARQAIAAGKSKADVAAMMRQRGFDPSGL